MNGSKAERILTGFVRQLRGECRIQSLMVFDMAEDYADKWAQPVHEDSFHNLGDPELTLNDFLRFCGVTQPPRFYWGLLR